MTERITDERELMMCPFAEDRICTRGGIEVDDPKCGPRMNMGYRPCALWHGGMCDVGRIAANMSLLSTLAGLLARDIDMDEVTAVAKYVKDAFGGKEES